MDARCHWDCIRGKNGSNLKELLQTALELLELGEMLPPRFNNHKLKGTREFYVEYDLVFCL